MKEEKTLMTLISIFEIDRKITICQCYRSCDCEPTTHKYYGVKYRKPNGDIKNKEFFTFKMREDFISRYLTITNH